MRTRNFLLQLESCSIIFHFESRIAEVKINEGSQITSFIVKQIKEKIFKIVKEKEICLLLDVPDIMLIEKDARDQLSKKGENENTLAIALVTQSSVGNVAGNLMKLLKGADLKIEIFSDRNKASKWLNYQFKTKPKLLHFQENTSIDGLPIDIRTNELRFFKFLVIPVSIISLTLGLSLLILGQTKIAMITISYAIISKLLLLIKRENKLQLCYNLYIFNWVLHLSIAIAISGGISAPLAIPFIPVVLISLIFLSNRQSIYWFSFIVFDIIVVVCLEMTGLLVPSTQGLLQNIFIEFILLVATVCITFSIALTFKNRYYKNLEQTSFVNQELIRKVEEIMNVLQQYSMRYFETKVELNSEISLLNDLSQTINMFGEEIEESIQQKMHSIEQTKDL